MMIELDGTLAGPSANGLWIVSGASVVRGLVINRFRHGIWINGSLAKQNVVEGNFIGTDVAGARSLGNRQTGILITSGAKNNTVGGTHPAASNVSSGNAANGVFLFGTGTEHNHVLGNLLGTDATGTASIPNFNGVLISGGAARNEVGGIARGSGNLISGNRRDGVAFFSGATDNHVVGNLIGTDISGSADLGNGNNGILVSSGGQIIGGTHPQAGNVVSGNDFAGVNIFTSSNTVQGNFVGTDVSGREAIPNRVVGVTVQHGAAYNLVGGLTPNARNIISGNGHGGLEGGLTLTWSATDNLVQGNYIGTDVTGKRPLANQGPGLYIAASASDNVVGGTEKGAGNRIAFNADRGLKVHSWGTNAFLGNSVHSNGLLGIDLGVNGVTHNDPGDLDVGPNRLQNFPVLIAVTKGSVQGTLNSTPSTSFRLEFFANDECDPAGYGEGEAYLGSTTVVTDGSGSVAFELRPGDIQAPGTPAGVEPRALTATATDPNGNTSEFSVCVVPT
jgi:hypothetical protein